MARHDSQLLVAAIHKMSRSLKSRWFIPAYVRRKSACFGRVGTDLLNVIAAIADRGAGFKSLKDAWADTTSAHGRLMLTVLGGLAEFERELIRARTGEGRKRAKERGVRFGRPRKMTPHQRQEALQRLAAGETQARNQQAERASKSLFAPPALGKRRHRALARLCIALCRTASIRNQGAPDCVSFPIGRARNGKQGGALLAAGARVSEDREHLSVGQ
jgi:hypothetical protein